MSEVPTNIYILGENYKSIISRSRTLYHLQGSEKNSTVLGNISLQGNDKAHSKNFTLRPKVKRLFFHETPRLAPAGTPAKT